LPPKLSKLTVPGFRGKSLFLRGMKIEKEATILIHSKREDPFNRIPKDVAENRALSYQARGLMSYLLGKPTGWRINVWDLVNRSPHGKAFVRSILNELRILGFMKLEKRRNEIGEFERYQWLLSDKPTWFNDTTNKALRDKYLRKCSAAKRPKKFLRAGFESPPTEIPDTEKRTTVEPILVSRVLNKTECKEECIVPRKSRASALRTRMKSIRASLRDLPGDACPSNAPAAAATVVAFQNSLPEKIHPDDLNLATSSPECVMLLRYWLGNYKAVFGTPPPRFSAADIMAASDLAAGECEVEDVFAAIVTAWSKVSPVDPQAHNPFWACNRYSRSLALLAKTNAGQTSTNFARMMLEMDWRAKRSQVEKAWVWLDEAHRGRAGIPKEEAEGEAEGDAEAEYLAREID